MQGNEGERRDRRRGGGKKEFERNENDRGRGEKRVMEEMVRRQSSIA